MSRGFFSWRRYLTGRFGNVGRRPRHSPWRPRPFLEVLEDRWLLSAYVVTNTNSSGTGSLSDAIVQVDNGTYNEIDFAIGAQGSAQTINAPTSGLPAITQPVYINGLSQGGSGNTTPLITLNGSTITNGGVDGLYLATGNCSVSGLIISAFTGNGIDAVSGANDTIGGTTAGAGNVLYGNLTNGLLLGGGVSNVLVEGNYIGTNPPGNAAVPNVVNGIDVLGSNNTIGGTTAGVGNLISGNSLNGILLEASGSGTVVQGNDIGTNVTGSSALGNSANGIEVNSSNNTIGGTGTGAGNVISGNSYAGVAINAGASGVQVQGNSIGTNAAGTSAVANNNGVVVNNPNNTIGGTSAGAGNVISGNSNDGLQIEDSGVAVQGNSIGLSAVGNAAVANGFSGVDVYGSNDTIGGMAAGAGNLISGNAYGLQIEIGASGVQVQGNSIGTDASGSHAVANTLYGVAVHNANNTIGGTGAGAGNVISGNGFDGLWIGASGVTVQGNSIGTDAAGTSAVANVYGIEVNGPNNTIGGTSSGVGNVISGNGFDGLVIDTGNSGVVVQGNFIGTNAAGTSAVANVANGVEVNSSNNTIGGTVIGARNVISGNGQGILIDTGNSGVAVQSNYIGTNAAGTSAVANNNGIEVAASNNTLGGATSQARNVISGNSKDGVLIYNGASGVQVLGNYIGTSAAGNAAVANNYGVEVDVSANTIGGTVTGAHNVISGNLADGVEVNVSGVTVQGNFIGTDASGSFAVANENGVAINASGNTLGGTTAAARNVISGNNSDGVFVLGYSGVAVQGNYIGTNYAGTAAVGNGNGIESEGSSNTIGGASAGAGNLIAGNVQDGVLMDSLASFTQIQGNSVGVNATGRAALGNGGNGIEVFSVGNTLGGSVAGARNIISGNGNDGLLLDTGANNNLVQANYVGPSGSSSSPAGNSGNGIEVASAYNTIGGTAAVERNIISANAADGVLLDSSASATLVQGNYIGTNSAGNAAQGTGQSGLDVFSSNNTLGGTSSGARNVIAGNAQDGVLLEGSATGNVVQGDYLGVAANGTTGVGNSANGIELMNGANTLGGSTAGARNVISGNVQNGVLIDPGASGAMIQGNYIGTVANGSAALGNGSSGIEVGDNNARIGGTTAAARNVISGNFGDGVLIDSGVSGTLVQGNFIGTNSGGTTAVANSGSGVEIQGSSNTVGGTLAAARNLISGNSGAGVLIANGGSGNSVQGNYVGTNLTASAAIANGGYGVSISGSNNTIGGSSAAAANLIADNAGGGVQVSSGSGNSIRRNSLFANGGGVGIFLAAGANNNLAAPTLSSATLSGTTLTVKGSFTAPVANVPYVVEFFASPAGDAEGKIYLGSKTVTPKSSGAVAFTFTVSNGATLTYPLITATLTDASGDTSAFSAGVTS
jgi:hypothetical protein